MSHDTTTPPAPGHEPGSQLETQADKATIMGLVVSKKALKWTVAGVVVAVAAIIVSVVTSDGGGQTAAVSGSGNNVNQGSGTLNQATGTCGQVGTGNTCIVQLQDLAKASSTDEQFKAKLAELSTAPPVQPGPWAFVVVDTGDLGLFARSTNTARGDRIGLALNRELVWVDCVARSDFEPQEPVNDVGPQWLQVRWKNDQTSTAHMYSDPSDTKRAWMYRGLLVPFGHDGDVPSCR